MEIIPIESGPVQTISYIVWDNSSKEAVVIDVPLDSTERIMDVVNSKSLKVKAILLTHSHWDHSGEAKMLSEELKSPVWGHKDDEYRLKSPNEHSVFALPFNIEPFSLDKYLKDRDTVEFGNIKFEVRHTPGHTEGGICFVDHDNKLVFSGDTLFAGSIGRTDFPGGNTNQLLQSIKENLLTLDDYDVFCGHGPASSIDEEKLNNPFLQDL